MINLNKNRKNLPAKLKRHTPWFFLVIVALNIAGCNLDKTIHTPPGYDITTPVKHNLGSKLDEISGICWINDTLILANNDESGRIFAINPSRMDNLEYPNIKFGIKDDYEDIVKVDSAIYLLVATGKIVRVTGYTSDSTIQMEVVATLAGKENEFESLYYDKEVHSLVMLCKDCHKEKKIRSAYRFDLGTNTLIDTPYYQIQISEIEKAVGTGPDFRPSAAALNPKDNKVYIVSAIGDLMVVINKKGKVLHAFKISPLMFAQPEGITFADNGDMYISNEIFSEPAATLLKFPYGKRVKPRPVEDD
ncbi:MAG TPA: hypothetical protein VFX58_10390 [Chitinophagaceae bacterium]|nr:hypothetical protein [Chitinophagaceae bacterium]